MKKLLMLYVNTFPNIEIFYKNNGGRVFVEQLFLDKSSLLRKLSKFIPSHILYNAYMFLEPLLSSMIVTVMLFKVVIKKNRKRWNEFNKVDRLYLNYAHLLKDRCKSAGIFDESIYWLEKPFSNISRKGLDNKTILSVFQLTSIIDYIRAYFYAIIAIFNVSFHNSNHYIRRSYTAFEFYLTYFAISKFSENTELVFANHIDRWAVLFDACHQQKKILVQHGIETKGANWPVKLCTVTTLYAFNEELGKDLAKALFKKEPKYRYMRPTITLVEDNEDKNYKVLIVCHPAAMRDREEYLIAHLQESNITVYAKTHYTTPDVTFYEELAKRYNYHLITTKFFPKVNTLISYPSTLVSEYEICGIPALMYTDYKSLDDIVTEVKRLAEEYKETQL